MAIFSHLQMTLAMRREFQFPADKRFRVKLTPMGNAMPLPAYLYHYFLNQACTCSESF
ncbi:hypothetical protein [Nostoc sp. NMS4]|uniref:hypothetical protein n=1 Tax=Nostoc sp. NMS4 TaxID=2815390 RepID=UPI0025E38D4C|nr:hypothetical protein [Nostoc sp. NMS4]MBN3923697.1 hypothetical protein [Nostoc sp. NMS4]